MFTKDKDLIARIRNKKFLAYCAHHKIDPARCKCLCGGPATSIKFNSPACDNCLRIEADLGSHHGSIWALNPDRVRRQKIPKNSIKQHEVGPFDPDINGLRVCLG